MHRSWPQLFVPILLLTLVISPAHAGWDPLFQSYELFDATGPQPNGLAAGDFNGDGLVDLIVANTGGTDGTSGTEVSILYHSASPGYSSLFGAPRRMAVGIRPKDVAVADMNLDGKLDFVTLSVGLMGSTPTLRVVTGTGSDFNPRPTIDVPSAQGLLGVADLNADGLPDVVATINIGIAVLLASGPNALAPPVNYIVGSGGPSGMTIADATGDGIRDILVALSNGLYILPGNNSGTFSPILGPITTGTGPQGIAVALLNGDAIPDLVVACGGAGTVWTYLGNGGGAFQAPTVLSAGAPTWGNARALPGDVDGDGDADLVSVSDSQSDVENVTVFKNNGSGSFAAGVRYDGLWSAGPALLADVNQDGRLDVVATTCTYGATTVGVLLNEGTGTFRSQKKALPVIYPAGDVTADFNRDGKLDIAVADSAGIRIGFGNGDGTFTSNNFVPVFAPICPLTADFDRNGKPDLIYNNGDQAEIRRGLGDGTFVYFTAIPGVLLFQRSMVDLNCDGRIDILGSDTGSSIVIQMQQSNQSFIGATPKSTSLLLIRSLCTGDWNRDGSPDVAVCGEGGISTFPGSAAGTLGAENIVRSGIQYVDVCAADLNRDGIPDLVGRRGTAPDSMSGIDVFLGAGTGLFGSATPYGSVMGLGGTIISADVNIDGIPDLLAVGKPTSGYGPSAVEVLLGNGQGGFPIRSCYGVGNNTADFNFGNPIFKLADFNRDGAVDILAPIYRYFATEYTTLLATPPARGNSYQASTFYSTLSGAGHVAVGDLNRDGRLDAVSATLGAAPGVAVHLGTANGSLGSATTLAQSWATFRVGLADLNRDGILDIVASNYGVGAPRVSTMLGIGNGTFGARSDLFINAGLDFEIGDMNRDGIPDVVTATQDSVRILTGNGNGTFTPATAMPISPVYDLDLADLDNDGVLDVICAGNTVSILFSHSDGTLGVPIPVPGPITSCTTLCVGDFNRDGWKDIVAPSGGAYYLVWGSNGSPYNTYALTNLPYSANDLAVGEAQADAMPFLYAAHNADKVEVLKWNPLGAFESVGSYGITSQPEAIALGDMDRDGITDIVSTSSSGSSLSVTLHGTSTITGVESAPPAATRAVLRQNYPNPFNPVTTIRFTLPGRDHARLSVFDVQGHLVADLVNRDLPPGEHSVQWSGTLRGGHPAPSGVYFYRLVTGAGFRDSKRMIVVK